MIFIILCLFFYQSTLPYSYYFCFAYFSPGLWHYPDKYDLILNLSIFQKSLYNLIQNKKNINHRKKSQHFIFNILKQQYSPIMKSYQKYQRYGNYILNRHQLLGQGAFGKVYRGYRIISQNSFGSYQRLKLQPVAIKEFQCQSKNYQEISILRILKHPNIIRYIDYKIHGNYLLMIMQICQQGSLEDLLAIIPQDENLNQILISYYAQIIAGIKFMNEKKVLHRDIKPSNILIKDNVVKIADFGTSKLNQDKEFKTLVGTPLFASPELLGLFVAQETDGQSGGSSYTEKSDIWSLGLVLYMMFNYQRNLKQSQRLKASLPWSGKNGAQILKNLQTHPLLFKHQNIPPNIKQIITHMLQLDPSKRMSFKQLFSLQQFSQSSKSHIQLHLNQSNLAISKSFLMQSSIQDEFCLTHTKQQQQCVVEQIQKQQIDWQLLKLLQIKDSQHYEDDEVKQAIQFYTMLLNDFKQTVTGQNRDQNKEKNISIVEIGKFEKEENIKLRQRIQCDLHFVIQKKIFQLQSWRLWNMEYVRNKQQDQVNENSFIQVDHKEQTIKQVSTIMKIDIEMINHSLEQIKNQYSSEQSHLHQLNSLVNPSKFSKLVDKPKIQQLTSKQTIILQFIKPQQQLLRLTKQYIKLTLNQELLSAFYENKIKCNMNLTSDMLVKRNKIYFIYSLLMGLQFEFSWKLKNKLSSNYGKKFNVGYSKSSFFETFKSLRNSVNIRQIINRIKEAYSFLKIANVQIASEK